MANNLDSKLRRDGKLYRANSFAEFGIRISDYIPTGEQRERQIRAIREFQEKFTKMLKSQFREKQYARTDSFRPLVDVSLALDGVPECFVGSKRKKRMPLQIGVNISAQFNVEQRTADMRIAAVLAVVQLCKLRGQPTDVTMVYGNCPDQEDLFGKILYDRTKKEYKDYHNHYRIRLSKGMALDSLLALGDLRIREKVWAHQRRHDQETTSAYHISQLEKQGIKEFDFCLDRLELSHREEEERIKKALGIFGVK